MKKFLLSLLLICAGNSFAGTTAPVHLGGNTNDVADTNFWAQNNNASTAVASITADATNKFGTNVLLGYLPDWAFVAYTNMATEAQFVGLSNTFSQTITNLSATNITRGVFPISRLATGTPTGTKFIRDDGTLAVPAGGGGSALTNVYDSSTGALINGGLEVTSGIDVNSGQATIDTGGNVVVHGFLKSDGGGFQTDGGGGLSLAGGVGAGGYGTTAGDYGTTYGGFQAGSIRYDYAGISGGPAVSGGINMDQFTSSGGNIHDNGGSGILTAPGFYAWSSAQLAYLGTSPNLLHYNDSDGNILTSDVAVSDVENVLGATGPFQPQINALDVRRGSFNVSYSASSTTNALTYSSPFPGNTVATNILLSFTLQDASTTALVAYPVSGTTNGVSVILVGARTNRIAYKAELKK